MKKSIKRTGATITIAKLDSNKVEEFARQMGYDPKKPIELNEYINTISKMDYWDISRTLFFGNQYVKDNKSYNKG
jgi:hypothetical protein